MTQLQQRCTHKLQEHPEALRWIMQPSCKPRVYPCPKPTNLTKAAHPILPRLQHTLLVCFAGTSRSPSVVLAAIMKAKGLALPQALDVLKARAPHISPNPGFMAQLELWGEMGYQVDEAHPAYKQFLLDQV